MSNNESSKLENTIPAPFVLPDELTKYSIRRSVWQQMNRARLVNFPRPCWGRIPNFKGCELANKKLIELNEFKQAKVVKVNPDKPQEPVRISVLENRKHLLVPIPRLREGLLNSIVLNDEHTNKDIKAAARRTGIETYGKPLDVDSKIKIDLVVLGSVAVSKEGYRLGKGEGFADLEFAMMMRMGAVNQDTVVVTTVHDNQVFDHLPKEIFKSHDVPVDIIVTPTQVIRVDKRLPEPAGIDWSMLSERRLNLMPILQKLHEEDKLAGKDVTLKEVDTDIETQHHYKPIFRKFNRMRFTRRPRTAQPTSESQDEGAAGEGVRPQRMYRRSLRPRRRSFKKDGSGEPAENNMDKSDLDEFNKFRKNRKNLRRQRNGIDFSLRVSNIDRNVRVRDLKAALAERGVKPSDITWRGYKGFCVLHFAKPSKRHNNKNTALTNQTTLNAPGGDNSIGVDNILESLQELKLSPDSEHSLIIEPAKPISRIETTDVTSV